MPTLTAADVSAAARVLYLEPAGMTAERPAVLARLAELGFPVMHEIPLHTADGQTRLAWQFLACERR